MRPNIPDSDDLDEEIRGHLALSIKERIERGEDPASARLAALKEFRNVTTETGPYYSSSRRRLPPRTLRDPNRSTGGRAPNTASPISAACGTSALMCHSNDRRPLPTKTYEVACHEGNDSMFNMLSGARKDEEEQEAK